MEKVKEVLKRIGELINSFTKPVEPEKSLDELALEAGIGEADLKELKSSMGGVTNFKFADDIEETKKGKNTKTTTPKETQIQPEPRNVIQERRIGQERD